MTRTGAEYTADYALGYLTRSVENFLAGRITQADLADRLATVHRLTEARATVKVSV